MDTETLMGTLDEVKSTQSTYARTHQPFQIYFRTQTFISVKTMTGVSCLPLKTHLTNGREITHTLTLARMGARRYESEIEKNKNTAAALSLQIEQLKTDALGQWRRPTMPMAMP